MIGVAPKGEAIPCGTPGAYGGNMDNKKIKEGTTLENAGMLDLNAELELWTRAGRFKLNLNRKVDIKKLDRIIGKHIL